jgi:peptidoglycan hydrolase-like protein with peptidoglycan-binding domain
MDGSGRLGFLRGVCVALCLLAALASVPSVSADEVVRAVQKKLADLGYYKGRVDGSAGSMTHAAIRRFQLAENLKVTGELNHQTLARLGVEAVEPAPDYSAIGRFFADGPLARAESQTQVAAVRVAQEKLASAGLYAGPHNGLPGEALSAALAEWQAANGLRTTGKLDERTAATLGIER